MADDASYIKQIEEENANLMKGIKELRERVQYLVDNWPEPLEDGGITFPDGELWEKTK